MNIYFAQENPDLLKEVKETIEDNLKKAKEGVEPFAGWLKRGEDAVVPVSRYMGRRMGNSSLLATTENNESITSIHIVVTGGGTNTFWSGGDFGYVGSTSVDFWR